MPGLSASAVARYARAGLPAAAIAAVARLLAAGASRPAAELTASPPPRSAGRPAARPARPRGPAGRGPGLPAVPDYAHPVPGVTVALKNGWKYVPACTAQDESCPWQVNSIGWVSGQGRDYVLAVLTTDDPAGPGRAGHGRVRLRDRHYPGRVQAGLGQPGDGPLGRRSARRPARPAWP
jgi:hypothetical protein